MLKNSLTSYLPEFNGDLVDAEMLDAYLVSVETELPEHNYTDIAKAKAYWVAMSYFDAQQRASDLDGSSAVKSEKIDDISTTFKDGSTVNPYAELFNENVVKEKDFDFAIGFMVSS
jgi:hypothetical protein